MQVENGLFVKYNKTHKYQLLPAYVDRCKIIYVNMKDVNNQEFRRKIISGEFTP